MAGLGIENSWGKSKQYFRRHNLIPGEDFEHKVWHALSDEVLPIERVHDSHVSI